MKKKDTVNPTVLDSITQNLFAAQTLLRKRLLHLDVVQGEKGLPLSHIQVLMMLEQTGSMSVSEISTTLGIAKPNITPLVDRLIENGYVDRIRDTTDRRIVNVAIMDKGRQKLAEIRENVGNQVRVWSQNLSSTDMKELAESLEKITAVFLKLKKKDT